MLKWPKRWSLKQRVLLRVSQGLIDFACCLPKVQRGPLARLQLEGKYARADRNHNNTVMPQGVDLRLLNVVYADLIFVEDFPRLASGLTALSTRFPSWLRRGDEGEQLERWLKSWGRTGPGVGWHTVCYLDFTRGIAKDGPRWADYAHIRLIGFAPSAIAVSIVVTPSDLFARRLRSLLRSQAGERCILRWVRWRPLDFGFEWHPAWRVRRDEMEDAFLELQTQAVGLIWGHTKAGLAGGGPLPSVEVFVLDRSEGSASQDTAETEEARRRENAFWQSAGMPEDYPFAYRHDWLALRPVDDIPEDRLSTVWRALVDRKAFLLDTEGTRGFADDDHKITYLVSERLGLLAPMLACTEYADRLLRQISALRSELAPVLVGRNRRRFGLRRLGSVVGRMVRIASLDFIVRRMREEIDYKKAEALFEREGIPGLAREAPRDHTPTALVSQMARYLERVHQYASGQLALLKEAYSEIVAFERIKSEQATQSRLLWLTIVLVVLTTVLTWQVLPDSTRAYLLSAVRHLP